MSKNHCLIFFLMIVTLSSISGIILKVKADSPIQGVISIVFDDNFDNQYNYAWPSMQSRGIKGTFYIRTGTMETAGYMRYWQLQTLQAAGNEIGSHSVTHTSFTELTENEIRAECQNSKNTLNAYGLSVYNFAYPNGLSNPTVDTIVDDYYNSGRTAYIPPYIITNPTAQFAIPAFTSEDETDELASLQNFVDQVYSSNSWGIALFHNIIPNDNSSLYTTSQEDFETFLDYIQSKGVHILTVKETIDTMIPVEITTTHGTTSPITGLYEIGSTFGIEAFAPVSGVGERFVWGGWSGSGLGSYSGLSNPATITINEPITQNAIWIHEYSLTISSNNGGISPSQGTYWFEAGYEIGIEAFAPVSGVGERFVWGGWSGSGLGSYSGLSNPATITMNQPITEVATWKHQFNIILEQGGIGSDYSGNILVIDGISYPKSISLWLDAGSHSFTFVQELLPSEGKKYVWSSTSGITHQPSGSMSITGPGTISVNYDIQYLVNVSSIKGIATGQGWYDVGSIVEITLNTNIIEESNEIRYFFSGWSGDGSGVRTTSHSMIVNKPLLVLANWTKQFLIRLNQSGIPEGKELRIKINSNEYALPFEGWFNENSQLTIEYPEAITTGFITTYILSSNPNPSNYLLNSPINYNGIYEVGSNSSALLMVIIISIIVILIFSIVLLRKKNFI